MNAAHELELIGGRLCLDFVNTVANYLEDPRTDYLGDYDALLAWARHADAIDDRELRQLAREAARHPRDAEAALARAKQLREAMFDVFYAVAYARRPPARAIETLNDALATALGKQQLVRDGDTWVLSCRAPDGDLEAPLWPIVRSAAELLTDTAVHPRVHVCGDGEHDCSWMFVDESKSGKRRWCSMRDCGNRAKARRHYERMRQ